MLKLKRERKVEYKNDRNEEKDLFIKVYKLDNNKNGLNYRVIAREKRFGKIVHDKMFFTEKAYKLFIERVEDAAYYKKDYNLFAKDAERKFVTLCIECINNAELADFDVDFCEKNHYIDFMLNLKNAKNDKERDIQFEKVYPVYTGGCEGLRIKHKTNGVRIMNYDFINKIRYEKDNVPKKERGFNRKAIKLIQAYNEYKREYGVDENELEDIMMNNIENANFKEAGIIVKLARLFV